MAKSLPPRPDLEWLKKTAKQRLAELRAHDAGAKLHQAQHAIAEEYGFKSWRALKAHVDAASLDGEIIAAAIAGKADELAALLDKHPAKLRITGGAWDRPLLHLAAEGGHLACVELLLQRGLERQPARPLGQCHGPALGRAGRASSRHGAAARRRRGHRRGRRRARGRRDRLGHLLPACARPM